jgi:hypothetical protein
MFPEKARTFGNSVADDFEDTVLTRSVARGALGVLCGMLCDCALASAAPTTQPASVPSDEALVIPKGLWTFETYGSFASQPKWTREQLYSGTVGVGYNFRSDDSLTLELTGLEGTQPGPNVGAGAFDLLLRTDLIHGPGWRGFVDFGPGVLEAGDRLPAGGTDFNFFFKTGAGAAVRLWDKADLLVGARYLHISNARIDGPNRNPSINAVEGYVGLLFEF